MIHFGQLQLDKGSEITVVGAIDFIPSDCDRHITIIDRVAKVQVSQFELENILDEFIYKHLLSTIYSHVRKYWCLGSYSRMEQR